MSNCIDIDNCAVAFTHQEIDIDRFDAFLKAAVKDSMAWWFLQTNTRIVRSGKLGAVEISFGWGRSTHTNRDFRGTIEAIRPFMLRNKNHTFLVKDEFDGMKETFRVPVEFRTGSISGKTAEQENARFKKMAEQFDADYKAGKIKITVMPPLVP